VNELKFPNIGNFSDLAINSSILAITMQDLLFETRKNKSDFERIVAGMDFAKGLPFGERNQIDRSRVWKCTLPFTP